VRSPNGGQLAVDNDTDLGGLEAGFPATQCSLVRAAGSADPDVRKQAQDTLIAAYWKPVYKYIRVKWRLSNEDAKDLTQGFFAQALEKGFFDRYDPGRARFRTFVRLCVDGFVAKERRAAGCAKRGGGTQHLALDFEGADGELHRLAPPAGADLEDFFRQEWVRSLFALAVEDLRRQCAASSKETHFTLFERYDLDGPEAAAGLTYAQLGQEFGLPVTQVTNYLAAVRRRFRQLLLDRLRAATGSEEEFQEEARRLFGGPLP
jgi:DNA-directed RNA polymerase specialized sigma24 family protein